ncbi:MAG: hypothetical protein R2804_08585 [Cyclobacteriaceae bacterium]
MQTRRYRRIVSVIMLLIFGLQMMMPTISYALTSGPTAPEYTSFEPVDTTDMVNLNTGDLVYNMPLLEVPGPEGGFPLSLSYHSGITLDEEASWVGLGWTLNPGAIARTVNGNPDDQFNVQRTVRDFDRGGERNIYSVGIGVPGASYGLDVGYDSNLGLGIGFSGQVSLIPVKQIEATGINPTIGAGIDPFGGAYVNAGIGITGAAGLSSSLSLQTNFNTVGAGFGFGYQGLRLGASITNQGLRASTSVAGSSFNQTNSQAGRITTEGFGFSIPAIPIGNSGLFVNLGYRYLRYYSDEESDVNIIGALHADKTANKNPDNWTFDSYALLDPDQFGGIVKENDPEVLFGGSFPSYDQYVVNTQGITGTIQPYIFDNGTLFRQNVKVRDNESAYLIKYNSINDFFGFVRPVNFRFKNDFSNSLGYNKTQMDVSENGDITFPNEGSQLTPVEGYNSTKGHLAGSKHVEWFTNNEVINSVGADVGLMNYHESYPLFDRSKYGSYDVGEQVGAFMITNESGVTYHYTLPVYGYDEHIRVEKIGDPGKFHREDNPHPYAYTWLLTAITGPDFVDRNANRIVDDADWGYWVKFEYGLSSGAYRWRNPGKGFNLDLDNETQMFSYGMKQLMYLNKISTRTHSAYFLKSVRKDGKGSSSVTDNSGLFKPFTKNIIDENGEPVAGIGYPTEQLKLDKVILVSNADAVRLNLEEYKDDNQFKGLLRTQLNSRLDEIGKSAIRIMNFGFDYELCQGVLENGVLTNGVLNSFDLPRNASGAIIYDSTGITLDGKLTLKSMSFMGKGGISGLIPPTTFEYGNNVPYQQDHYDMWGFYKSDYQKMENKNLERLVSQESAQNIDAWSLTKVNTSLGAEIEITYEPDTYAKSSIENTNLLQLANPTIVAETTDEILFDVKGAISEPDITVGVDYDPVFLLFFKDGTRCVLGGVNCQPNNCNACAGSDYVLSGEIFKSSIRVEEIVGQKIKVKNTALFDKLKPKEVITRSISSNCENCSATEYIYNNNYVFIDGVIKPSESFARLGGGIRVKALSINNSADEKFVTNFDYSKDGKSSGATSYEPVNLISSDLNLTGDFFDGVHPDDIQELRDTFGDDYQIELQKDFSKLLAITRDLPSPGIMYSRVTLSDQICRGDECTAVPGKKVFEFQTYDDELVRRVGRTSDASDRIVRCVIIDPDTGQEEPVNCSSTNPPPEKCYNQAGQVINCNTTSFTSYFPTKIQDFSSWLGVLKSTKLVGVDEQIISETTNNYLHDGQTFDQFINQLKTDYHGQGIVTQLFNENKRIKGFGNSLLPVYVFSSREEYPLVPLGQTTTNYKTRVSTTTTNKAFDFYTGLPTKIESIDSYGSRFVSVIEPAYKHYPAMGLKVHDPTNKHMLIQTAANYNYRSNDTGDYTGLVDASIQTWSNLIPILNAETPSEEIWRQHDAFQWNGQQALAMDGTYPISDFVEYDFLNSNSNSSWEKVGGITLYDSYSHALEATDINDNVATTKMDPKNQFVIASAGNASYNEMVYSGIEYSNGNNFKEGGVSRGLGTPSPARAHTGKYSLLTGFNKMGFNYHLESGAADLGKKYRASVWVYVPGEAETQTELDKIQLVATTNGIDQSSHVVLQKSKSKSWYLLNLDFDPQGNETTVKCINNSSRGVYFDDFRVHPLDASMSSYVYDNFSGELNYILDANNFYTRFEYDAMGRLIRTSREMLNFDFGDGKESFKSDRIINEVIYNYGKSN